jgi:signal transduction histidine kinase/DNA-binding response OmpR family regulator
MTARAKVASILTGTTSSGKLLAGPDSRTRVLVVDDDPRNLLTISEVLGDVAGVTCAASGEEALRFLLRDEFAVILLDVLMPGLDGYETAELIRRRDSSKSTPIIFLTAIHMDSTHILRGYDVGAVDYLFKPFDPMMLRSKVGVFVELFEKTQEIKRKAVLEQELLQENLRVNSEKLKAERALRSSEDRQEAIMRSLPLCVHSRSVEPPHGAFFVSGAVERLTGFAPEVFSQDPSFGLNRVHPDDVAVVEKALAGAVGSGAYACEFRWLCADGVYRHFLDQGVLRRDEDGEPLEIVGTMLDTTERKHLEDRLIHAQKLDAIGKLTGGVAHDFNNLLASIISGLGLLRKRATMGPDAERILEMTQHAARQGAELIARMLTFSRRQNLNPSALLLPDVVATLDSLLAPLLGGLVSLRWQLDDAIWPAYADSGQLEVAIMNLVINGRDAMRDGGVITIRCINKSVRSGETDLTEGDYVVIKVEDTGMGIPPDIIDRVLEPFFTTKDVGKGTGLGLSTVYGFARQSGGTLRIYSEVERGTSVELWLPRAADKLAAGKNSRPGPNAIEDAVETRLRILLVDDSSELREMTGLLLGESGFEVECAGGGPAALTMLEQNPDAYDVIVTDYAMPLVSGTELVRLARNIRSDWPCVIITGYADADAIADRPNDVPVLYKPFEHRELVTLLRGLVLA